MAKDNYSYFILNKHTYTYIDKLFQGISQLLTASTVKVMTLNRLRGHSKVRWVGNCCAEQHKLMERERMAELNRWEKRGDERTEGIWREGEWCVHVCVFAIGHVQRQSIPAIHRQLLTLMMIRL